MRIEFTQKEKDLIKPLLEERYKDEESDNDILNDNYYKNLHNSIPKLINNILQNKPFLLTQYDKTNIQSCINPELGTIYNNQFIKKTHKEAIEWINVSQSVMSKIQKIDILESILCKVNKKYTPNQFFKISDLINSLRKCETLILSKYNDTYFYKVRFVKKNHDIFQIELSDTLEIEYKKFTKSSKSINSKDLRNRNVKLFSKEEALKEIQDSEFVPKIQNKNTFDFIIKILSGE